MTRTEWLIWSIRNGRTRNLRAGLAFELYSLGCLLCGHRIAHWLKWESPPAGKYILIERPVPLGVKLLDRLCPGLGVEHADRVPYTPEAARDLQRAGRRFKTTIISYRLGGDEWAER